MVAGKAGALPTFQWAEVNGVTLRYELSGAGPQTVVLIHELGGALDSFDECVAAFRGHFRVLRYDQRGFGHSEKVRTPMHMDDMVNDLAALLDSLAIREPVHVTGAGVGGGLSIAFAARRPERVARMVVASPATFIPVELHERLVARAAMVEKEGMRCFADLSLSLSYPEELRGNRERFEQYRRRWLANDPFCFAAINRMHMKTNLEPELGTLRCPTLVIGTRFNPIRTPEMSRRVAEAIPGARFVEADSGHFMPAETPELFASHAIPFFRGQ